MDHEEMKKAYLRALSLKKAIFNSFCNTCKADYDISSGELIDVLTLDTNYKVWYCDDCVEKDLEYVE
jgi:hypothetical protein